MTIIPAWARLLWDLARFTGNPQELPADKRIFAALLLSYTALSYLQAWLIKPDDLGAVAAAALLDTAFTFGFFAFFIAVRARSQLLKSLSGMFGLGVVLSFPQIALSALMLKGTPWESAQVLMAMGVLVWTGLALARVLQLAAGFTRILAVMTVLTYLLADERIVSELTGVTG